GITAEAHIAEWRWHGNLAGPKRNQKMVAAGAELCLALHRDIKACRDTKDCIRQALVAKIPTYLIDDDQGDPKRLDAGDKRLKCSTMQAHEKGRTPDRGAAGAVAGAGLGVATSGGVTSVHRTFARPSTRRRNSHGQAILMMVVQLTGRN